MRNLLLLGVGNCAKATAAQASGYGTIFGTTRNSDKAAELKRSGIEPIVLPQPLDDGSLKKISDASKSAHVLASIPPDHDSEERLAKACSQAEKIVYISSTAVYGKATGDVNESTPVDEGDPNSIPRLRSEKIWRSMHAIILRAPGLYSSDYGLHISLLQGKYRLPGDGTNYSSRIHLEDLATIVLKAFQLAEPDSTFVIGDECPSTHFEVVSFLCNQLQLPMPASAPLSELHYTLRSNRQVNSQKVRDRLGVQLKFPTYIEGFEDAIKKNR